MSGFQVYNSAGALTIDSNNKSVVTSQVLGMPALTDTGFWLINSAFGNGSTLGYLPLNYLPSTGLRWFQPQVDGKYFFAGSSLYEAGMGRFMMCSNTGNISSGYLDVFDGNGSLIWSAASASQMPRIQGFFDIPAGYDLSTAITLNSPIANPWICISQCPGNIAAAEATSGYSGILIKRYNATQFGIQYVNRLQKSYTQAMGNNGLRIALASFTGY